MKIGVNAYVLPLVLSAGCGDTRREAPPDLTVQQATTTSAADQLDELDTRRAVPLLPRMALHQKASMRGHLEAVQAIVLAAAEQDFDGVQRAASPLALSQQVGAMCTHMGSAAPGFAEQALAFHRTADAIQSAARAKDPVAVLRALGTTLGACTSCHATWKQQVLDPETYSARSARDQASTTTP